MYPQWANQPRMSPSVIPLSARAIASMSASWVRAAAFFKSAFIFENACSIGLKSGEYSGLREG